MSSVTCFNCKFRDTPQDTQASYAFVLVGGSEVYSEYQLLCTGELAVVPGRTAYCPTCRKNTLLTGRGDVAGAVVETRASFETDRRLFAAVDAGAGAEAALRLF